MRDSVISRSTTLGILMSMEVSMFASTNVMVDRSMVLNNSKGIAANGIRARVQIGDRR